MDNSFVLVQLLLNHCLILYHKFKTIYMWDIWFTLKSIRSHCNSITHSEHIAGNKKMFKKNEMRVLEWHFIQYIVNLNWSPARLKTQSYLHSKRTLGKILTQNWFHKPLRWREEINKISCSTDTLQFWLFSMTERRNKETHASKIIYAASQSNLNTKLGIHFTL